VGPDLARILELFSAFRQDRQEVQGHWTSVPTADIASRRRSSSTRFGCISGFTLRYRDVEELLAERGLEVSYESVRRWVLKFGPGTPSTILV
jgi:hypothetical protein